MTTSAAPALPRTADSGAEARGRPAHARLAGWGRAIALLLALAFGRAGFVPPCTAHIGEPAAPGHAAHGGVHNDAHGADDCPGHAATDQRQDEPPPESPCTCLGDCHQAPTIAWLPDEPPTTRVAAVVAGSQARRASSRPVVARLHHPHVLPLPTAPPARDL